MARPVLNMKFCFVEPASRDKNETWKTNEFLRNLLLNYSRAFMHYQSSAFTVWVVGPREAEWGMCRPKTHRASRCRGRSGTELLPAHSYFPKAHVANTYPHRHWWEVVTQQGGESLSWDSWPVQDCWWETLSTLVPDSLYPQCSILLSVWPWASPLSLWAYIFFCKMGVVRPSLQCPGQLRDNRAQKPTYGRPRGAGLSHGRSLWVNRGLCLCSHRV